MASPTPLFPAGTETPMMAVCSWCSVIMRPGREPVTHGICPACAAEELRKLGPVKPAKEVAR